MKYLILIFLFYGCAHSPFGSSHSDDILATLWIQNAAEYKALDYQAYNTAKRRLNFITKYRKARKPFAVVLDIDETVLDNSPYQASNILKGQSYDEKSWGTWIEKRLAMALPGVVDFIHYAQSKNVEVFLVSNRKIKYLADTFENLKERGIKVKRENIFLKTTTSSKLSRRKQIQKSHEIILLIGDTLADFHEDFEKVSKKQRDMLVEKYQEEFGDKYIILPNPMYGDWVESLYNYDSDISDSTKARMRKKHLYPFK